MEGGRDEEMKHLADISIDEVENGYEITIKKPGKGRLGVFKEENKKYVAESTEKLKEILKEFVKQLEPTR